jgi:DNA-binding SARP family transcriptional activator
MRQGDGAGPTAPGGAAPTSRIPSTQPRPRTVLDVRALGGTAVLLDGTDLSGPWLRQRAGRVLKYLVLHRRRTVSLEEIVDVFWAGQGGGVRSARQAVHLLRGSLEPTRAPGAPSSFIRSTGGGYALDAETVQVDIDAFEEAAREGLRDRSGDPAALERAVELYGGELFADEVYAEWVLSERDRLHDLVADVLRRLLEVRATNGHGRDPSTALGPLARLADLEPFDLELQRTLIEALVSRGRWSQAVRHATVTRARFERVFGERPELPVQRP